MLPDDDARKLLSAKREELLLASSTAADARKVVELDQQSVGRLSRQDALQQQAMAKAQEQLRQRELQRIEQAMQRLEEGEYGYCLQCGEEIATARLAIDPMAELCINCKS